MALLDRQSVEATRWVGPPEHKAGNKTFYSSFRRFGDRFRVGADLCECLHHLGAAGFPAFFHGCVNSA